MVAATTAPAPPSLLELPDGLHTDVSPAVYHAPVLGMVSKSALEHFERSPAHYFTALTTVVEAEPNEAFAFGTATHAAVLEPDVYASTYVVAPKFGDLRFKENKAAKKAWEAENVGKVALTLQDARAIEGIRKSIQAHPLAARLLDDGVSEITALWTDPETGLRCRTRSDRYVERRGLIVDLKTAQDASPSGFAKATFNYHYDWSHALYRAGFAELGRAADHFVFLVVEKTPPYAVALYQLDEEGVRAGHARVRAHMRTLRECLGADRWPGYSPSIETIVTPRWVTARL